MSKFVLTAQLKLQAPTNTRQVVNQMQGQLGGLSVPVQVTGAGKAQKQLKQLTAATNQASSAATNMGKSFGLALKRFAAFTVASRAVSLFTNTLANAVQESIDFQREVVKIAQVTGKSVSELKGLNAEITRLATTLGTSSKELLGATRILAQAGIQANDLKIALEALAKTTLAPTFEDITKTAEGAVAILAQFGQGVGALKEQLGAINAVAGQFAVESGDLIGAIRRTGGVFKAAGGDLNEFLGLFTSIRATTRESAESIATGLRTILTRIQRPATIQYLKELGITLTDVNGRFVGPFEAVKRLSKALADVPAGDLKFVEIAEELGGFRQIGKVIPLLQEFETAERARQAAVAGAASLDKDAATAQQALAVQIEKTKEEFFALVRGITETSSFQVMVKTALGLANAFIKVADALKPLIPLIGVITAAKFAGGIASFGKGVGSAVRGIQSRNQGGKILAFARGGMVPGSGNRDTVPAMLQPGEFVIRKSSVDKIGSGNLAQMNAKGYNKGGVVEGKLKEGTLGVFALVSGAKGQERKSKSKEYNLSINNSKGAIATLDRNFGLGLVGKGNKEDAFDNLTGKAQQELLSTTDAGKAYISEVKTAYKSLQPTSTVSSGAASKAYSKAVGSANAKSALGNALKGVDVPGQEIPASMGLNFTGSMLEMILGQKPDSPDDRRGLMEQVRDQVYASSAKGMQDIVSDLINSKEGAIAGVKKGVSPTIQFNNSAFSGHIKNLTKKSKEGGKDGYSAAVSSVAGFIQEGLVAGLTGAAIAGGQESFDFPELSGQRNQLKKLYGGDFSSMESGDAKPDTSPSNFAANAKKLADSITKNKGKFLQKGVFFDNLSVKGFNKGGGVSAKDTVPAMLTPGEFVINKKAAQSIGYSNLNTMNKKGVTGFNKGGPVQYFQSGGGVSGGGFGALNNSFITLTAVTSVAQGAISLLGDKSKEASDAQAKFTIAGERSIQALLGIATTLFITKKAFEFINKIGRPKEDKQQDAGVDTAQVGQEVAQSVETALANIAAISIQSATINVQSAEISKGGEEKGRKGGPSSESFESTEAEAKYLNKRKSQQEKVVQAREQNLSEANVKAAKAGKDFESTRGEFREEVANKKRLQKRKTNLESQEAREADIAKTTGRKKQAIDQQVVEKEQAKVNADDRLAKDRAKDQRNRDNLAAQQETQRVAEFQRSEAQRKRDSGTKSVAGLETEREARAQRVRDLELKKNVMDQRYARGESAGTVADPSGSGKRLSEGGLEKELAAARDAYDKTDASVKKAKESVNKYDAEIKQHDSTIAKSKKAQAGLGEAVERSSAKVRKSEYEAEQAGESLAKARRHQVKADKEDATATKNLNDTSKKLKSTRAQLNQSEQRTTILGKKALSQKKAAASAANAQGVAEKKLADSRGRLNALTSRNASVNERLATTQNKVASETQKNDAKTGKLRSTYVRMRTALAKTDTNIRKAGNAVGTFAGKVNSTIGKLGRSGRTISNFNRKIGSQLVRGFVAADRAIIRTTRNLKKLAQSPGVRAGAAGIARGVGKVTAGAGAAIAIAAQIGTAIAGFISETSERQKEAAIGAGNVGGAATAARRGARAEGFGRLFSIGGLVEALADPKGFKQRVETDAANKGLQAASQAGATRDQSVMQQLNDGTKSSLDALKDITATSSSVLAQSRGADQGVITEATNQRKAAEKEVILAFAQTATTAEELEAGLAQMAHGSATGGEAAMRMARSAFAVAEANRALARAQFDNLKVVSAFNKANLGVDQFVNSLQTGSSTLADSIATVEAAATNIGMGAEGRNALESIRQRVLTASGASEGSAQAGAINRQFSRASTVTEFMGGLQQRLGDLDISKNDSEARSQIVTRLTAGVTDPDVRKAIEGAVQGMDKVVGKDASQIIAEVTKSLGPLKDGAIQSAKALLKHETTIAQLTQQRRQAELSYIAAQRQAIDSQLQFAQTFEDFGGAKLTSDQKLSANLAKFNLGARDAGVRTLRSGSVSDIQNVAQSIRGRLNQQQVDRATGQFRDAQGIDADRIKETNSSIKDLVGFINSQIQATKEQIAVIEQRNKAEQDSINALLKGDVSGFVEGQGAAGAASALRAGDSELAQLFSPAQISQAIEQLRGEGADEATLRRAGEIAAQAVGLDARAGQVLTGTTDELNDARARGRSLAQAGAEVSQMLAESAMMEVAQAEVAIEQANVIFKNSMAKTNAAEERAAQGLALARGGMVYASRGMFVPRGTDTVPAMLTPGEFVVNRSAVQRGNNLQILRAMNGNGATVNAGAAGAAALSSGGQVGYYQFGDLVQGLGGVFGQALPNLENIFRTFSDAVQTLSTLEVGVNVSKPIDVNVRLLNDNILTVIDDKIRDVVLETVAAEIPKYKSTQSGDSRKSTGLVQN